MPRSIVFRGSIAGGLVGAGIAALTGASDERVSPAMAVLTAAGGIGGLMWTEHCRGSHPDASRRLSRIEISPSGILPRRFEHGVPIRFCL